MIQGFLNDEEKESTSHSSTEHAQVHAQSQASNQNSKQSRSSKNAHKRSELLVLMNALNGKSVFSKDFYNFTIQQNCQSYFEIIQDIFDMRKKFTKDKWNEMITLNHGLPWHLIC